MYLALNFKICIMGAHIKFSLEHRYFKEWFEVDVDWNYPFLPRIGEFVNAWIRIEACKFDRAVIGEILSPEGLKSLNSERYQDYAVEEWLYEVGMECSTVYSVSYYTEKDDPANIYAIVSLNETGIAQ